MLNFRTCSSIAALLSVAHAGAIHAQPAKKPAAAPTTSSAANQAELIANKGDSLAAYAMLDSALKVNKRDAPAWHKYGMMAWSMARSSRGQATNSSQQAVRWLIAADSAFHLAVAIAPDSAMYWRDMARFGLNSGSTFLRFRAEGWLDKGLAAAVRTGDSLMVSDIADESGMIKWHRYELVANQALDIEDAAPFSWEQQRDGVAIRRDHIVQSNSFTGFADYTEARTLFVRATNANPISARPRHHMYMTLAERDQWPELLRASNAQLKNVPWDYEAWLARGLASTRLFQWKDAAAAFDSALTIMAPEQKDSYTRFTRILPPNVSGAPGSARDSASFERLGAGEKRAVEEVSWALLDPLAETSDNEFRTEFYARVAFADFRWTLDDLDKRGSNTDRGDLYVRFGPPDRQLSMPLEEPIGNTLVVWRYNSGFNFTFHQPAMYGTARHAAVNVAEVAKTSFPMRFDNVPIAKTMDTVAVRVTAFRGTRDSLDIVVASDVPAKKMVGETNLGGDMPFTLSSRVIDGRARQQQVKSSTVKVNPASAPERLAATWTQRVGEGANFVRVEAFQPDTKRVAHGSFSVDPTRSEGFGMSDVLLGEKLQDAGGNANRWSDVKIEPKFGTFHVGEPIGLLWENYKLKADNGSVRYKVNIDVRASDAGGIKGIVARVRSALGATLGQGRETSGTIVVTFPRTAPARDVIVESMSLDLSSAKPGLYQLKVEVVDAVSGAVTSRVTQFRIEK